jgi:hypothetical protein
MDFYKTAPTFLEKNGRCECFRTQDSVDDALNDGWHEVGNPPSIKKTDDVIKKRGRKPKKQD